MKHLFFLALCLCGLAAFSQWTAVDSVNSPYKRICFYDGQTGFLCSDAGYKKTTDGGQSWTSYSTLPGSPVRSIYMLNTDTGFSALGRTIDGGATWASAGNFGYPFCFTNNNQNGFAVSYMPFGNPFPTFSSTDGGNTWQMKSMATPDPNGFSTGPLSIAFGDSQHGLIGTYDGSIYYTTNGCTSWTRKNPVNSEHYIGAIHMFDAQNAVALAYNNMLPPLFGPPPTSSILQTTDGGNSWQSIAQVPARYFPVHMEFTSTQNGYFADGNYLYKTTDGGYTWAADTTVPGVRDFTIVENNTTMYLLTWDSVLTQGGVFKRDLGVGITETTVLNDLKVYPNPVTNTLYVNLPATQKGMLTIAGMDGKVFYYNRNYNGGSVIDVSNFPVGVYVVTCNGSSHRIIKH